MLQGMKQQEELFKKRKMGQYIEKGKMFSFLERSGEENANCSIWLDIRINRGTILTKIKYSLFSMLFIRNAIIKKGKEKI